jgi:phosphoglycerate kinase
MSVKSIEQVPPELLRGSNVLVRIDAGFESDLDFTLPDSLPTLNHLINSGARTLIVTHSAASLDEVTGRLSNLLGRSIKKFDGWDATKLQRAANQLGEGELLMLEDLSLQAGEETNDPNLAELLSRLCDVYCNDAFALAHQVRASTVGVARRAKLSVAGAAFERELNMLNLALENPQRPALAVLGGELSIEKLKLMEAICQRVNIALIGGQLCFPFLIAQGHSLISATHCISVTHCRRAQIDEEMVSIADRILTKAKADNCDVMTPLDFIAVEAGELDEHVPAGPRTFNVDADELSNDLALCDIGQRTRWSWSEQFGMAKTIFWHGPLGICELEPFTEGTRFLAIEFINRTSSGRQCVTLIRGVICGSSLLRALRRLGIATERIRHLSGAGRASLHYFAGRPLPAVDALGRAEKAARNKLRILIPLNGSKGDLVALRAATIVAASDAEIFLLHVRSGPDQEQHPDLAASLSLAEKFEQRVQSERIFAQANAALASRGLLCADQIVAQGEPSEIVLRYASRTGADLIVLSAAVCDTYNDAQRVIERAPCAVLAVCDT